MSKGFDLALSITRFGIYPGDTAATEAVSLVLADAVRGRNFGGAFDALGLDLHFRHQGRPPAPFDATDIARYHAYLETLPKITVRAKARRIELRWAMALSVKSFLPGCAPSVAGFRQLGAEVMQVLTAAKPRLAKLSGFDHAALVATVQTALAAMPGAPKPFLARIAALEKRDRDRAARRVRADPWAALGIDWTQFHAKARTLLDDPFFWDPVDEHAPVGNDTGADVIDSYRAWRRRKPTNAIARLEKLLDDWQMSDEGDDAQLVRDQAFIALAFAQAMLDGAVDADVSTRAIAAIDRQQARASAWPAPKARRAALAKLRRRLGTLR